MRTRYFDKYRAVGAINFFIDCWGGKANLLNLVKLIYHADKTHLNKTGYTITRDSFAAMDNGPVNSGVYDLLKEARGEATPRPEVGDFARHYLIVDSENQVSMRNPAPEGELSDKEVATLKEVFSRLGHKPHQAYESSHDEAWAKARKNKNQWMAYDDMVDDPETKRIIKESAQDSLPPAHN